jgi:hypothetical protein
MQKEHLNKLALFLKSQILQSFDKNNENVLFPVDNYICKGLFFSVIDTDGSEAAREGLMSDELDVKILTQDISLKLSAKLKLIGYSYNKLQLSNFCLTFVNDVVYLKNPLEWDENKDGVYFQWGQKYRGFFLPNQIKKLQGSKIDILDRLLCHEIGLISNLWRMPEGLVFKIDCEQIVI